MMMLLLNLITLVLLQVHVPLTCNDVGYLNLDRINQHHIACMYVCMTIAVSIASCERSFSKLKLMLSYLRPSMEQERLSDLVLLSTEREAFNGLHF